MKSLHIRDRMKKNFESGPELHVTVSDHQIKNSETTERKTDRHHYDASHVFFHNYKTKKPGDMAL